MCSCGHGDDGDDGGGPVVVVVVAVVTLVPDTYEELTFLSRLQMNYLILLFNNEEI